jgi:hypothetical protein
MGKPGGSTLLLEEYFTGEDQRFIDQLRSVQDLRFLSGFADAWKKDPRPWAREQIFAYLDRDLDCAGHHPLVKRLFKNAEARKDDLLMAAFLVAFDRSVRRERRIRTRWDFTSRTSYTVEALVTPQDSLLANPQHKPPVPGKLFSHRTRQYLRRRAWRYFRRMGFSRAQEYTGAVTRALVLYRDDDLKKGENILDSWGFIHILFGKHPAVAFDLSKTKIREGHRLAELRPAPYFAKLWNMPDGAQALLKLLTAARSRAVRLWAHQLLEAEHSTVLTSLPPERIFELLDHFDPDIQALGAKLLTTCKGLEKLPLERWMTLLKSENLLALQSLCDTLKRHVAPERMSPEACVILATSAAAPVARLGLSFFQQKELDEAWRAQLPRLAEARCRAEAGEITRWALVRIMERYHVDAVSPFFDSHLSAMRSASQEALTPECPGYADAALWARLLETPFDDVRLWLVAQLERRVARPRIKGDLTHLWTSVLLAVHRGGRQKAAALRQLCQALADDPARAETLLPVLVLALRSIRGTEQKAGLAAAVGVVARRPELANWFRQNLPEVEWMGGAA